MATIVKTPSGSWKALIRRKGWPTSSMAFRTKRDAEDWARRTEDEMIRGVYVRRSPSQKILLQDALKRYLKEITPTKRPSTQRAEKMRAKLRPLSSVNTLWSPSRLTSLRPIVMTGWRREGAFRRSGLS
jgi:hypothetical protein